MLVAQTWTVIGLLAAALFALVAQNRRLGDRLSDGLQGVRDEMARRFGEVDQQFGEMDRRFGEVDRQLGEMRGDLASLRGDVRRHIDRDHDQ